MFVYILLFPIRTIYYIFKGIKGIAVTFAFLCLRLLLAIVLFPVTIMRQLYMPLRYGGPFWVVVTHMLCSLLVYLNEKGTITLNLPKLPFMTPYSEFLYNGTESFIKAITELHDHIYNGSFVSSALFIVFIYIMLMVGAIIYGASQNTFFALISIISTIGFMTLYVYTYNSRDARMDRAIFKSGTILTDLKDSVGVTLFHIRLLIPIYNVLYVDKRQMSDI